jgi:hypothetical protein
LPKRFHPFRRSAAFGAVHEAEVFPRSWKIAVSAIRSPHILIGEAVTISASPWTWSDTVDPEDRPLILIVCRDPERLTGTRQRLREVGFLPASGRAVDAAISLLSQVRVDGCVLCHEVTADEAERLTQALDRVRPGCPKLYLREYQPGALDGWTVCFSNELDETIVGAFNR